MGVVADNMIRMNHKVVMILGRTLYMCRSKASGHKYNVV